MNPPIMMKVHKVRVKTFCRFFAVSGSGLETLLSDAAGMVGDTSVVILIGGALKLTAGIGSKTALGSSGRIEACARG